MRYEHATKAMRNHDPATSWNLWVYMLDGWYNCASHPDRAILEVSAKAFSYAKVAYVFGNGIPEGVDHAQPATC